MHQILNKFTTLKQAKELLETQQFILSDPFGLKNKNAWEDKNDVNCLKKYRDYKKAKTILASCLVDGRERYHHWKVYANGQNGDDLGVCIEFNKSELVSCFEKAKMRLNNTNESIRHFNVRYRWISEFKEEIDTMQGSILNELPFRKRKTYGDEKEYRIIYENLDKEIDLYFIPINRNALMKITLSSYATELDRQNFIKYKDSLNGYNSLKVNISGMLDHKDWQNLLKRIKTT